ncbi:MAG TPA: cupin domain-containing protein [Gemmatimonadales bacterium]|nr:cupin domain-containing protein [Gemmatimonadales bacterium]
MPRYTYRRLSTLPATDDGARRSVDIGVPDALPGVSLRRTVMQPGTEVPVAPEPRGRLFVTLSGRGVMLLDGDRIEVSANEVVYVPGGCPCGLQTLGGTPWTYLLAEPPS